MVNLPPLHSDKTPLQDHCGIVGIFSAEDAPLFETGYQALLTLQTRGYDGAGFWAIDSQGNEFQYKGKGMIREVLSSQLEKFRYQKIRMLLLQTRYGTSGNQSQENVQPLRLIHQPSNEVFSVAHNGQFSDQPHRAKAIDVVEDTLSDTVLFAQKLSSLPQTNWDHRLSIALARQKGAYSLLIATSNSLYACRDSLGIRPLVYGRLSQDKPYQWIIASETSSLAAVGANHMKEVMPGQMINFTHQGIREIKAPNLKTKKAQCIFENVYIMDETSKAHLPTKHAKHIRSSPNINQVRFRSGQILAQEAPLTRKQIDMVIGVPGTGITGGQGFANALKLPYVQAIIDRDTPHREQRTFMSANIDEIAQKVLVHFAIAGDMIKGKKLCLVDDSLVRGNITTSLIKLLKDHYGAKSVHIRILCPPIDKPCHLGVSTRQASELIVYQYQGNLDAVRKHIGAASLAYISANGLKEAITNDPQSKGFCMGCMQGHLPPLTRDGKRLQLLSNQDNAKRSISSRASQISAIH